MKKKTLVFMIVFTLVFSVGIPAYAQTSFNQWTQTTKADFESGQNININTISSPGDASLMASKVIAAGNGHAVVLRNDGVPIGQGGNYNGQLPGEGYYSNIKSVAAGAFNTLLLREDGTVQNVGTYMGYDALGWVGDWRDIIDIDAGEWHNVGLKKDGTVLTTPATIPFQYRPGPDVSGWTDIVQVEAGYDFTAGLKRDGTVELAYISSTSTAGWTDIKAISASELVLAGLKTDGTVVSNSYDVSSWTNIKAIGTGHHHIVGLKQDGTVVEVGWDERDDIDVSGWTDVTAVDAGAGYIIGLKQNGTVIGTGQSWPALAANWSDVRQPWSGTVASVSLDTGSARFGALSWSPLVPSGAPADAVRFQVATNNDDSTWSYVGPDGSSNSFYTNPGQLLWSGHNGDRYLRYKAYLHTGDVTALPVIKDVTVNYLKYGYSGVLQPINADGSSIFKMKSNSIIPVKFKLTDVAGYLVTDAVATIDVVKMSGSISGSQIESVITGLKTNGTQFVFNPATDEYIYNISTSELTTGTFVANIRLDDGQELQVPFSVK